MCDCVSVGALQPIRHLEGVKRAPSVGSVNVKWIISRKLWKLSRLAGALASAASTLSCSRSADAMNRRHKKNQSPCHHAVRV